MKIEFHIEYKASFGEEICVVGNLPALGAWNEAEALTLTCVDERHWQGVVEVETDGTLEYAYMLKEGGRVLRREWGSPRAVNTAKVESLCLSDAWRNVPEQKFLYTSAFANGFSEPVDKPGAVRRYRQSVEIRLLCPYVMKGQTLVMVGESDLLGDWEEAKALRLRQTAHARWSVVLDVRKIKSPLAYKFAILDRATGHIVHWEEGDNRVLLPEAQGKDTLHVYELDYRRGRMDWRAGGVAIPVFSLRTEDSFGVGEFSDLRRMVDWAVATGMKMIQILPVNDTTMTRSWTDSYPYNAISIYALHPVYLGLGEFPLKDKALSRSFRRRASDLNALPEYDYEKVLTLKEEYLAKLYEERGTETLAGEAFQHFFDDNRHWLFPYACFCALRDKYHTARYTDWRTNSRYSRKALEKVLGKDAGMKRAVEQTYFAQYLLHEQLSSVKEYAHRHGVVLKGDVPIGISRDSVEAWVEPELFNLDTQTGAPPDDFSRFGQNWGFPTYNWNMMARDGYQWWIRRFRKMADYFDAYRIDHILGFFRIWEIPAHSVQGLLGYFSPSLPLTKEEIAGWGVPFDEQRMLEPYIHERCLPELFGAYADEVSELFLNRITWKRYELKPFCNTQVKIRDFFAGKTDDKSAALRDGLYRLCNEVLFVRDKQQPDCFHPRITAQQTFSFRDLNPEEQTSFNRLYEHFFYQRHNTFWAEQAMRKLPVLTEATGMLVCGEDLGMIPACVPEVMRDLQILSLEIERMPKQFGRAFADLQAIPYRSVCTTSTHDMSPIRAWWLEDRALTQRYYNEVLHREGEAPADCTPDLCRQIVQNHLQATAMLTVLPLQDWLSVSATLRRSNPNEERINIPAVPNHYWRYRMHLTLEDLLRSVELNADLKKMLNESGR